MMAAVFCCFFATMDDPTPGIRSFGLFSLLALPLAALYMFAILPAIDGFVMLTAVMAPPLLFLGLYIPNPRTTIPGLATIMTFANALAFQENFTADFAGFLNGNLSVFVGLFAALIVTSGLRTMSVDASARRLLVRTWKGLARLARARTAPEPTAFAGVLVDRLGLLTPKLAVTDPRGDLTGVDALRDLRIGMNLVAVQAARQDMATSPRLDAALDGVGDRFAALAAGRAPPSDVDLLGRLDAALRETASAASVPGITGLVGLRRNLFPAAPDFTPEPAR